MTTNRIDPKNLLSDAKTILQHESSLLEKIMFLNSNMLEDNRLSARQKVFEKIKNSFNKASHCMLAYPNFAYFENKYSSMRKILTEHIDDHYKPSFSEYINQKN